MTPISRIGTASATRGSLGASSRAPPSRVRAVGDGERARALGAEESACGGSVVRRSEEAPFGHVDRRTAADLVRGRTKRARRREQIVRRDLAVGVSPIEGVALTELR